MELCSCGGVMSEAKNFTFTNPEFKSFTVGLYLFAKRRRHKLFGKASKSLPNRLCLSCTPFVCERCGRVEAILSPEDFEVFTKVEADSDFSETVECIKQSGVSKSSKRKAVVAEEADENFFEKVKKMEDSLLNDKSSSGKEA